MGEDSGGGVLHGSYPRSDLRGRGGGFQRTHCACPPCKAPCREGSGPLLPQDIPAISKFLHGAPVPVKGGKGTVAGREDAGGTLILCTIPSVVLQTRGDGSCMFLSTDGRCEIHPVAPWGCAYYDSHMSREEGDRRTMFYVNTLLGLEGEDDGEDPSHP